MSGGLGIVKQRRIGRGRPDSRWMTGQTDPPGYGMMSSARWGSAQHCDQTGHRPRCLHSRLVANSTKWSSTEFSSYSRSRGEARYDEGTRIGHRPNRPEKVWSSGVSRLVVWPQPVRLRREAMMPPKPQQFCRIPAWVSHSKLGHGGQSSYRALRQTSTEAV